MEALWADCCDAARGRAVVRAYGSLAALDAVTLWDASTLNAKQSTCLGLGGTSLGPIMVRLAYISGAVPAALAGASVAWRSRGPRQIFLVEGCLAALGFGLTFGGVGLAVLLWGARPPIRIAETVVLAGPASIIAGLVCTWLTRRWQAPQT